MQEQCDFRVLAMELRYHCQPFGYIDIQFIKWKEFGTSRSEYYARGVAYIGLLFTATGFPIPDVGNDYFL